MNPLPAARADTDRVLREEREHTDVSFCSADACQQRLSGDGELDARPPPPVSSAQEVVSKGHGVAVLDGLRATSASALELAADRARTNRLLLSERASADRALAARDDILGIVSHDLNGLIGIIDLNAALIVEDAGSEHRGMSRCASDIQLLSARMKHVLSNLTDLVRIDAERLVVARDSRDVGDLLRELEGVFSRLAGLRGIALALDQSGLAVVPPFDKERISQVLTNLLNNALKFTPAQGHVVVRARSQAGALLFSVADDGCGVSADQRKSMFDRFWQAGTKPGVGLGLGLYICKRIVEEHGGSIWAESEPGHGTTVFFTVPPAEREPQPRPAATPS